MNKGHSQNISSVIEHVNLMVGNVTQDKIETMVSVSMNAKNQ